MTSTGKNTLKLWRNNFWFKLRTLLLYGTIAPATRLEVQQLSGEFTSCCVPQFFWAEVLEMMAFWRLPPGKHWLASTRKLSAGQAKSFALSAPMKHGIAAHNKSCLDLLIVGAWQKIGAFMLHKSMVI
jgi:hypothetical protein